MTEEEVHIHWQGRIVALEMLMRVLVMAHVCERHTDPLAALTSFQKDMFGSMQNMTRPIGEKDDAIWSAAIEALELCFRSVAARISEQQAEGE